jgi:predicted Zn finger-like uncharacterized protein
MILTCPNCGTQYVVKDGAVPPEGRQVRCAACKHSWHQDPDEQAAGSAAPLSESAAPPEVPSQAPVDETVEAAPEDESFAEASLIEPRSGPEAEERAYEEAVIERDADVPEREQTEPVAAAADAEEADAVEAAPATWTASDWRRPPAAEPGTDMFNPFAEDGEQPRRRGAATTVILLVVLVIAAAALFWFFAPPSLKAKLGLASAGATPLQLVTTHMDRQHLESGNDLLTLTGRVINPSAKEQAVPPIQAQLKNRSGKVVYSWTIQPPAQSLAAGASASFNSAEVSVPPGGDELTITLGNAQASGV